MSNDPPKRRWYQFSLRTLLMAVTVFVVLLGGGFANWRLGDDLSPANSADSGAVTQAGARPLHEQRADAACDTFMSVMVGWELGFKTYEDVYLWSRRWMESITDAPTSTDSERVKAIESHLSRMRRFEKKLLNLKDADGIGPEGLRSQWRYYVVEAEFWLQEAEKKE